MTSQCHDVITAVGAEPFGPQGTSDMQRHPQWGSVVILPLFKCPVLLGCFHIKQGKVIHSAVYILARTVWFELSVTWEIQIAYTSTTENSHSRKTTLTVHKCKLACAEKNL